MNALSVFSFQENHPVRVVLVNGEPAWFVAADVCKALDIADNRAAVRKLDDDEKGGYSLPPTVGVQSVGIVNESGLYTLILRCRDAVKQGTTARRFRKWVTNEVLPAIQKR
ncbi:BRO-N domain-containing protein [Klebsiella quasipneumoniae]|uniref:BRO-N domain-containing protein n=1 Tax=Klebsiella quasipneumoniae TaxID=1463165 RepID=UPI00388DF5C2